MSIAYLVRVFLVCRLLVTFVIASGTNPSLVSPEDHTYNLLLQFNVTKPSPQFLQSHPPSLSLSSNGNNEEDLLKLQKEPHKSDNQNDNKNVQKTSSHSTASANSSHHHHHHHHTIHHNLSSPAFQNIAKHTLHVMHHHCLRTHFYETNNPHNHVYPERFIFPADAEQHFAEIQAAVQPFVTQNRIHSYAGYDGPWIENLWISTFSKKPLGYFRGFIPIFLNWIDSEIVKNMGRMIQALSRVLRKDCVYITVSQGDAGLHEAAALFPNILVLSAGGFGHIPLPLIKGELPAAPLVETDKHLPSQRVPSDHNVFSSSRSSSNNKYYYDVEVSFYGTDRRERHNLLMAVSAESEKQNLSFTIGYGKLCFSSIIYFWLVFCLLLFFILCFFIHWFLFKIFVLLTECCCTFST